MKPVRDPERAELKHLIETCPLSGKVVLEIGCGDGTFSRQYANETGWVVGIDPLSSEVELAMNKVRIANSRKMSFLLAEGESLPFHAYSFDVVIFASSL
jgi:ubiquinone/menaquinone biosynthesis C-methylase UbiE